MNIKIKNIYISKSEKEFKEKCRAIHRRCLMIIHLMQSDIK